MADTCIFCGKETTVWNGGDVLVCGGVSQPVCGSCRNRYVNVPLCQRAKLALNTGRARTPERIQEFLDEMDAKWALEAQRQEYQEKTLMCCGRKMEKLDEGAISLARDFFEGFTNRLWIFRCECCGQVKFFDASFLIRTPQEEEVAIPEEAPIPAEKPRPARSRFGKKPPWEK